MGMNIDFEKRIYGFDLLRAIAIFFVVHGHGRNLLEGTLLDGFPWFNLPHGVDIFFVLSGFLIGYSFMMNANLTNGKLTLGKSLNFWKRSVFRIMPNYYLILIVNYILVNEGILNGSTEKFSIWLFASFTQNLFSPFYAFFWESWSLATQEWFYLLFPILIMILGKFFKLKHTILIVSFFFILTSILYRFSISNVNYNSFWWDVSLRKVAISRIDSIFLGVIAAWFRFYYKELWSKFAIPSFVFGILFYIVIAYIPREQNSIYLNVFYLTLSPAYIMFLFPLIDKLKDTRTFIGRFITRISVLSYAMYLLNLLIIQIFKNQYQELLSGHASIKYLLYWFITLLLSYLLYSLFESPIAKHGNRLLHTTKMMYKRIDLKQIITNKVTVSNNIKNNRTINK